MLDRKGRAIGVSVEWRRKREDCGPGRQQRLRKPVFYIGVIETVDADIVELGNGRRSMPETVNDAGDAAVCGIDVAEEKIIDVFCGLILPGISGDDTVTFERDGKRVEVTLEFGSGKGRQTEDLKKN